MALSIQDRAILEQRIKRIVTAELLDRARAKPYPPYDADIVEVLDFVRRNPDPELPRYLILEIEGEGFAVARRATSPGGAPQPIDAQRFPDRDAAEHAVLEQRLRDYGVSW